MTKKIVIASDHAGFSLKEFIKENIEADFKDLGTDSENSVHYPDFANATADFLKENSSYIGILICGSGVGISIAANRHSHIRAALCHNQEIARLSREHNNANILVLGARLIEKNKALEIVKAFLNQEFDTKNPRHTKRIDMLS